MARERTPEMRSAMLAASFARWQRTYHPYPVVAPIGGQRIVPLALPSTQQMTAWKQGEAGKHTCHCVEQILRSCRHPECEKLFGRRSAVPPGFTNWFHTEVDFDQDTYVTTIHVYSLFNDVPEAKGKEFIVFAEPPLWSARVEFFQSSTPGRWAPEKGEFEIDNGWAAWTKGRRMDKTLGTKDAEDLMVGWHTRRQGGRFSEYFIYEHADWQWSPADSGGIINELKISPDPHPRKAVDLCSEVLRNLVRAKDKTISDIRNEAGVRKEKKKPELSRHQHELEAAGRDLTELRTLQGALKKASPTEAQDPPISIKFGYRLERSIQSRFLSSWMPGGLSHDDGTYEAAWLPSATSRGLLCIKADKEIRFTRQADAIEDYSKLLNLLAPAMASMLMEELAHHGVVEFLKKRTDETRSRPHLWVHDHYGPTGQ